MNLTISSHHLELTPAIKNHVTEKIKKITRHFNQVVDVKVTLSFDEQITEKQLSRKAECNVHVKGRDIYAQSVNCDLYAAIDELAEKIDRQILRHKEKTQDHHTKIDLKR